MGGGGGGGDGGWGGVLSIFFWNAHALKYL